MTLNFTRITEKTFEVLDLFKDQAFQAKSLTPEILWKRGVFSPLLKETTSKEASVQFQENSPTITLCVLDILERACAISFPERVSPKTFSTFQLVCGEWIQEMILIQIPESCVDDRVSSEFIETLKKSARVYLQSLTRDWRFISEGTKNMRLEKNKDQTLIFLAELEKVEDLGIEIGSVPHFEASVFIQGEKELIENFFSSIGGEIVVNNLIKSCLSQEKLDDLESLKVSEPHVNKKQKAARTGRKDFPKKVCFSKLA